MEVNQVEKVTKDRIFSLAVAPSTDEKTFVLAGDKWGKIGIWDVVRGVVCSLYNITTLEGWIITLYDPTVLETLPKQNVCLVNI